MALLKPLFVDADMDEQEQKLLAALALVMEHLRQPEALPPIIEHLCERQRAYELTPDSFEIDGVALQETLSLFLGDQWTPELQHAWTEAYDAIVTLMLDETPAMASERDTLLHAGG